MARHVHITQRDELVCDFCSGPGVRFRYPCDATITMAALDANGEALLGSVSDDDWAACAACAIVIAENSPAKLANHVVDNGHGDPDLQAFLRGEPAFRRAAVAHLTELYNRLLPVLGERTADDGKPTGNAGQSIKIAENDDDN